MSHHPRGRPHARGGQGRPRGRGRTWAQGKRQPHQGQDVGHDDVVTLRALGLVRLELEAAGLQEGHRVVVVEGDVFLVSELPVGAAGSHFQDSKRRSRPPLPGSTGLPPRARAPGLRTQRHCPQASRCRLAWPRRTAHQGLFLERTPLSPRQGLPSACPCVPARGAVLQFYPQNGSSDQTGPWGGRTQGGS